MRKLSKIEEGLFTATVKRGYTDEKRKEDNNISKINPIDLGSDCHVYIADVDYEEGGRDHFTFEEAMEINERIKSTGWRLPYGSDEICDIFFKDKHLTHKLKDSLKQDKNFDEFWASVTSNETNETVMFGLEEHNRSKCTVYWCNWERPLPLYTDISNWSNARVFAAGDTGLDPKNVISTNNYDKESFCKIRLVKDK